MGELRSLWDGMPSARSMQLARARLPARPLPAPNACRAAAARSQRLPRGRRSLPTPAVRRPLPTPAARRPLPTPAVRRSLPTPAVRRLLPTPAARRPLPAPRQPECGAPCGGAAPSPADEYLAPAFKLDAAEHGRSLAAAALLRAQLAGGEDGGVDLDALGAMVDAGAPRAPAELGSEDEAPGDDSASGGGCEDGDDDVALYQDAWSRPCSEDDEAAAAAAPMEAAKSTG